MESAEKKISKNVDLPFLRGGGEMGKMIRSKNWEETPLGDPSKWHQSLKAVVAITLNNPFGKHISWGKEFIQIYNDGYRPILGKSKHPDALGISAKITYAEIWDTTGPLFERVMQGEAIGFIDFELELDRNGYLETCYFDLSYTPIYIENGVVGGVLATVTETTEKRKAELELKEINEQLAFAIEATELGTFDYNPNTDTFSGNDRLKSWFGLPVKAEIELRHAIEAIADEDKDRVVASIRHSLDFDTQGNYDIIYTIVHPKTHRKRIVRAKARTWFNAGREAIRFNGTLQDITDSETTARKLAESERHLRLMINQAPVAIAIFKGKDFVSEIVNTLALQVWGKTEKEILGVPIRESMPGFVDQGILDLLIEVYKTEEPYNTEERPLEFIRDGERVTTYISFSFEPMYNTHDEVHGVMAIGIDVTDQVLTRRKIDESNQQVRNVVENAPFPIGVFSGPDMKIELANQSIIEVWGKGSNLIGKPYKTVLPEVENQGVFDQLDKVYNEGQSFEARNQLVDLETQGKMKSYYFNYQLTPLYDTQGNIYGVMNTAADVTDLNLANIRLEESEKRFRESVKQAPLGIAILRGEDFVFEIVNETYLQIIKRKEEEVINKSAFKVLPELRESVESTFKEVITNGIAFHSEDFPVILNRDGQEKLAYFNLTYHPLKEPNNEVSGIMVIATEVTEFVNAQKALKESEEHFRNMIDDSPMAMAVLRGENLTIEMANPKMLKTLWQKELKEIIGKKILDVFPELQKQKHLVLFQKVLKNGIKQTNTESIFFIKHGDRLTKFYIDFEYAPLLDELGKVSGIIITANDVTSKVESRKKLENAEERLRIATEATELATWELQLKERELIHSPRLAEIFGHPLEFVFSHATLRKQILEQDVEEIVIPAMKESLETGIYKYEARIIKPDNSMGWISTRGKLFVGPDGKPASMVGTVRDITSEKLHQKELEDSEQKFRTLADSMPHFVWTSDKDGNLNYFNSAVYDYAGKTLDDLLNGGWINMVHPDDRERNIELWQQSMNTGVDFLFEHRFARANGDYRWQLSRATPQKDRDGSILMWVGASTDIQEMKEVEEQKDFFIGMASHELKTPITSIKGYVQILQSMYADKEDVFLTSSLKTIEKQIRTLIELITDLLDLSKIKSGTLVLNKTHFSVDEFIQEYILEIQQINPGCNIFFKKCESKTIFADRERLGQVLINFLTNAIKYSTDNYDIYVSEKFEKGNVIIGVKDSGIGIDKKAQERIFERFYRVEGPNEKTYPGFGIGLNIAAEIIERHNGTVNVKSELGKGSEFSFSVPIN